MDKHLPNNLVMVTKFLVPVTKCFYSVVENGDFRFIRSLSSEHFTYMATRQRSGDTTVIDLGHIQAYWTVSHQISQNRCVIRQKLL